MTEPRGVSMVVLNTARLSLRPFQRDDARAAHGWFGDATVMRYTPTGPDDSLDRTRARLAEYERHQRQHGFSKWLVIERASGRAVGDAGLIVMGPAWIDLGFRFLPSAWGRGFATEVGAAWVTAAFERLGLVELNAFVHPQNGASLRVLVKLGFGEQRPGTVLGMSAICLNLPRAYRPTPG